MSVSKINKVENKFEPSKSMVLHGDRVGVTFKMQDITTEAIIKQSGDPYDWIVVDDQNSWSYAMVGRK